MLLWKIKEEAEMEEKQKRANVIRTIVSSLRLVVLSGGGKYLAFTFIWLVMGAFTSFTAVFQKNFINEAAEVLGGSQTAWGAAAMWLSIWGGVELLVALIGIVSVKVQYRMWGRVELFVQNGIMNKVAKVKLAYFDDVKTHQMLDFVKGHLEDRISRVVNAATYTLHAAVQCVTTGLIIAHESILVAAIILCSAVPSVLIRHMQTEETYWDTMKNSHENRFQNYVSWLLYRKKYIKEMQFYNLFDYILGRYDQSVKIMQGTQEKTMKKYSAINVLASLINYAAIGVSLILIVTRIYKGQLGVGSFVLIYTSARNLQSSVNQLFLNLLSIGDEGRYIEHYFEVMEYEEEGGTSETDSGKGQEAGRQPDMPDSVDIEFKHVTFAYPQTEQTVLKDINLTIRQGEKIAIIGENGSGKSTFIALLTGLYQPVEGEILVNGVNIANNLPLLRENLSCTYQNFVHYEMSVADNIALGDLAHEHSRADIEQAAKKAGLYDEIMAMPKGFDTHLGTFEEGGRDLSGGQWQKLAMARNLLKERAKIMILDEPTAALDPVAESNLYREFQDLTEDRTVLLISHRLGATRLADRILVFHEGQIVEDGTHEQLTKMDGYYKQMYHAQAQWYV